MPIDLYSLISRKDAKAQRIKLSMKPQDNFYIKVLLLAY